MKQLIALLVIQCVCVLYVYTVEIEIMGECLSDDKLMLTKASKFRIVGRKRERTMGAGETLSTRNCGQKIIRAKANTRTGLYNKVR